MAFSFLLSSCEEEKKTVPSNPDGRTTGLGGTDDVNTIPKKLDYSSSFFGGSNDNLPASISLEQYLPPVGNQGSFGTCVGWATAYNFKTALEAIKFGLTPAQLASPQYQLSPRDLFTSISNSDKSPKCNGTNFVPAMEKVLARGVATQAIVPYANMAECDQSEVQAAWTADANKHKIANYRRIDNTVNAIKQQLANKIPVVLGAALDNNFMTWNNDAVITSGSGGNNNGQNGKHAMCIVGYDDAKGPQGAFRVVNSWGPETWGDKGFIWVDYRYMTNGFCFGNNLFVATNDEQKPNPGGGDNQPSPTGVDLIPWVTADGPKQGTGFAPNFREMFFDVYNIGKAAAPASSAWGYAYVYYNAYDANDYGLVFYDRMNPAQSEKSDCRSDTTGCQFKVDIAPDNSLGFALFGAGFSLIRTYPMPTTISGQYYLVMIADVTDKFVENDESNNIFYVTEQDPITFANGVSQRGDRGAGPMTFKNSLPASQKLSSTAAHFRTAVTEKNKNAYSPAEIIGMLRHKVKTGDFQKKVAAYRSTSAGRLGAEYTLSGARN